VREDIEAQKKHMLKVKIIFLNLKLKLKNFKKTD
jgi:hypothetical protein